MSFFTGFKQGFKDFGHNISIIINSLLLTVVYFLGVGLTSIFAKIAGKSFLDTEEKKSSYWEKLDLKKEKKENYYRLF